MKQDIIRKNIESRDTEISVYEIDIATFKHMIAAIEDGDELQGYRDQDLAKRLSDSERELRKVQMIRAALVSQVSEIRIGPFSRAIAWLRTKLS